MQYNYLDLLIVGAGPAGISAAVEARRAGIDNLLVVEKGPTHSFSIEKLYTPGKRVDKVYRGQDIECQGVVCIMDGTRESVLETMDGFLRDFEIPIEYDSEVVAIRKESDGRFLVETQGGNVHRTKTVIIAIGVFGRPNRPSYPLPPTLKGRIHFDLTAPIPVGESVLVVGGGNTALEFVEYLYPGHPVTLAYRGASFVRANEVNRKIMAHLDRRGLVTAWTDADIESVADLGEGARVGVRFRDGRQLNVHHVVYAIGGNTPLGFLQQAGIHLENGQPQLNERLETNLTGLFLAGDLVAEGRGSIVQAFNTGHAVIWEGVCQGHLDCGCPDASLVG